MSDSLSGQTPPSTLGPRNRWLEGFLLSSLALTITLSTLAICQQFYGVGWRVDLEVENSRIQKMDGHYRWRMPEQYRAGLLERRARFYVNGKRWTNQAQATRDLPRLGPGWFRWVDGGVNFTPPDGHDPRSSADRYNISTPYQFKPRVWWIFGSLLLVQVLALSYQKHLGNRSISHFDPSGLLYRPPDARCVRGELLVFVCALIAIFASLLSERGLTDHAFMVKGIPESDALAWYEMSIGLAEGHGLKGGFQNQRPFYTIYIGALFTLFGSHLTVAQIFNAVGLALAAAGLYTVGRLQNSRLLGLVLSISAMTATTHLDYAHAVISENGGVVLAVFSMLTLWQAAWVLSLRWSFAAGLLNGLAALTSGVTLLTLPLYAVILFLFPLARRTSWQHALKLAATYTLAASLLIGPWMARQKLVNDRLTLSYNTAEILAGGSDPDSGRLDQAMFAKAKAQKVDLKDAHARYDYFMQVFKTNVRQDPMGYLGRLSAAFIASVQDLPYRVAGFHLTLLLGLFGFGLWPALQRGQWLAFVVSCLLMTLWARNAFTITPLMMLAASFLAWRRSQSPSTRLITLLLIATVIATMAISALAGNVATKRFWLVADWSAFALLLAGSKYLIFTVGSLSHWGLKRLGAPSWLTGSASPPPERIASLTPPPYIAWSATGWLAFSLLCGSILLYQQLRGPHSKLGSLSTLDPAAIATQALARVALSQPLPAPLQPSHLHSRIAQITDLSAQMDAGEGTEHWLAVYGPRPYDRWVSKMTLLDAQGTRIGTFNTLGQGQLATIPPAELYLVSGVMTEAPNRLTNLPAKLLEVCLVVPLIRASPQADWEPDWDQLTWFPPTPEALAALQSIPPPQR